jgi:hypothetical protein
VIYLHFSCILFGKKVIFAAQIVVSAVRGALELSLFALACGTEVAKE